MESDGEWLRGTKNTSDSYTVDNYIQHRTWGPFGEGKCVSGPQPNAFLTIDSKCLDGEN